MSGTPGGESGTPGGSGGGAGKKQRAQNVVPVDIGEILSMSGDQMTVEGREVGMVVLVGRVLRVDHQATKNTYTIEDDTGTIDAVHWVDEGQENTSANVSENMNCRVIGAVRSAQDKKHVMIFKISQIENKDEIEAHGLEVLHAKLMIRKLQNQENSNIGMNSMSNSMMNFGSNTAAMPNMSSGNAFGNAQQDMIYKVIAACTRDEGIGREELMTQLKAKVSKVDLDSALDFLSGEGHIYSTIDDDHFKTIDS